MLDLAQDVTDTSRLGCQAPGLRVSPPSSSFVSVSHTGVFLLMYMCFVMYIPQTRSVRCQVILDKERDDGLRVRIPAGIVNLLK